MKSEKAIAILRMGEQARWRSGVTVEEEKEAVDMAIEALEEEPRPHGEWIYHKEWEVDGECAFECSKCGMGTDVDYNFCPNCGADMRKGDSDA